MLRYLRLYRIFWENCLAREAEFRANFWANLVANAGWLLFFVLLIKILFRNTEAVAGWTEAEMLSLTGTFGLIHGVFGVVAYQNLSRLPEQIRLGTFDFVVTRPVDSLFFVATRYVRLEGIGTTVGSLLLLLYSTGSLAARITPGTVLAYLFLCLCALVIYFSVYTLLMTLAFWFIRIENLWVLADVVFQVARYPIDIFRDWVRSLFIYVIPLAFVASFPARALVGELPLPWLAVAAGFAVGLFALAVAFWRFALRSYSSASS
ncbi:MAG: ABC transporter permease [Armatimonadota bacterium]